MMIFLAGLYGLRRGEITGLRWRNVDLEHNVLKVVEQQPYDIDRDEVVLTEMAPPKSVGRALPITAITRPWFEKQLQLCRKQKHFCEASGEQYYDNDLVISKPNGAPVCSEYISLIFAAQLRKWKCRHIRFHDLRHSIATNSHDLIGNFYTISEILGHTTDGMRMSLGFVRRSSSVTEQYVRVSLHRKQVVLDAYHQEVLKGIEGLSKQ